MSGTTPAAQGARPIAKPKNMSSRLLTMKFMQRAAASSSSSTSSTPANQKSAAPDAEAIKRALAEEKLKLDLALRAREKAAASTDDDAETRWELSYVRSIDGGDSRVRVVDLGYGEMALEDDVDGEERGNGNRGRMVFGGFKRKGETSIFNTAATEDPSSDASSDEKPSPKKGLSSLRGLTSISNAGPSQSSMSCRACKNSGHLQAECPQAICYACGEKGHMSMACPSPKKRGRKETVLRIDEGEGGGRKRGAESRGERAGKRRQSWE
ncbi:hypothetical protein RUND412_002062 [Rhizina undulata]